MPWMAPRFLQLAPPDGASRPQEIRAAIGLYYFTAGYYDSSTGRFIAGDPIGDGLNWYEGGNSNPLRFVDPTGLVVEDVCRCGY